MLVALICGVRGPFDAALIFSPSDLSGRPVVDRTGALLRGGVSVQRGTRQSETRGREETGSSPQSLDYGPITDNGCEKAGGGRFPRWRGANKLDWLAQVVWVSFSRPTRSPSDEVTGRLSRVRHKVNSRAAIHRA